MKNTLTFLFTVVIFCGCSKKQAVDLVKVGDMSWHDGYVLHVSKRDGTLLTGVSLRKKFLDGTTGTISADSATLSVVPDATDGDSALLTLHNAKAPGGQALGEFPFALHK